MIANSVIMIRPTAFGFNAETATTNSFQSLSDLPSSKIQTEALREFDGLADKLTGCGVDVIVFNDTVTPIKPDAVFPNNWFSTHADGTVILYPMYSPARRAERRTDIIERLRTRFLIKQIIDFTHFEEQHKFLEGTGSMVFDHSNRRVYANISPRTSLELLKAISEELSYEPVTFRATDSKGIDIYHTNVVLSVSDGLIVVCQDAVTIEKSSFKRKIAQTGKQVVYLNYHQLTNFAGNMLMLQNHKEQKIMVMSERSYNSLGREQISTIEHNASILTVPLTVIEKIGGGSARCMLAENFLPRV